MTPDQKVDYVEKQVTALEQKRTNVLNCPYCETAIFEGDILCCIPLGRAVAAVIMRKETKEKIEQAERIAEKVASN